MLGAEDKQFIVLSSFELSANLRIHVEFLLIMPSWFASLSSEIIQLFKSNKNKIQTDLIIHFFWQKLKILIPILYSKTILKMSSFTSDVTILTFGENFKYLKL